MTARAYPGGFRFPGMPAFTRLLVFDQRLAGGIDVAGAHGEDEITRAGDLPQQSPG